MGHLPNRGGGSDQVGRMSQPPYLILFFILHPAEYHIRRPNFWGGGGSAEVWQMSQVLLFIFEDFPKIFCYEQASDWWFVLKILVFDNLSLKSPFFFFFSSCPKTENSPPVSVKSPFFHQCLQVSEDMSSFGKSENCALWFPYFYIWINNNFFSVPMSWPEFSTTWTYLAPCPHCV